MRVFLDTNVLVSAYATRGLCADVLRLVLAEHELLVGEVVLEELERILLKKFRLGSDVVVEVVSFLRQYHVEPRPEQAAGITVRDADDVLVLSSALRARADVLVSGDRDLLDIAEEVAEVRIVDPRGFWELHRGS